jgi:SAM-dependent methyltransferase
LHSSGLARGYDAGLLGSALFRADEAFVLQHCSAKGPGRLVDLGCGTGRLLIPLARRGWWVLGVDLSPEMLAVARDKARDAGVEVSLLRANLVDLAGIASGSFDHASCLFSTLGMVTGHAARRRVVAEAARVLRPGGRFVLHVHNRWFHLGDRSGRRWLWRDLWRRWRGDPAAGDNTMPTHQGVAGLTLHLFSRAEALAHLREAGFRIVAVQPVGIDGAGPRWLANWRAYGFLIAAEKA